MPNTRIALKPPLRCECLPRLGVRVAVSEAAIVDLHGVHDIGSGYDGRRISTGVYGGRFWRERRAGEGVSGRDDGDVSRFCELSLEHCIVRDVRYAAHVAFDFAHHRRDAPIQLQTSHGLFVRRDGEDGHARPEVGYEACGVARNGGSDDARCSDDLCRLNGGKPYC